MLFHSIKTYKNVDEEIGSLNNYYYNTYYMPAVNLRKRYYDVLVRHDKVPKDVVDDLVGKYLAEEMLQFVGGSR